VLLCRSFCICRSSVISSIGAGCRIATVTVAGNEGKEDYHKNACDMGLHRLFHFTFFYWLNNYVVEFFQNEISPHK
jgi:hypothetical protein